MYRSLLSSAIAVVLALQVGDAGLVRAQPAPSISLDQLRERRTELAHSKRRVVMNNDGCDVLYFPKDQQVTVEGFLEKRTTPLAGTHVDTIVFCPTSSGFSYFTHNTQAGTLLARSGEEFGILPETRNIAQDLIDLQTDCLQAVVDFGHHHEMEVFWSMRMNDTHDVAHRPDKPYFLFPPLKVEHPDWLVGDPVQRTPYGRWSSVDYARPEIRELAFRFIEEVCRNYDVDGIELDFFRHLCYFKNTASGETADDQQREMMTDLMERVRQMTEQVGMQRGRPILVAVRVPDSVEYCRDMGFAIEHWMRNGLIDMLITTGYFRLNPWEYSVQLGHKYDVPVYPCLSDSRVRGETRFLRRSTASYRGRAMNAWAAGADGLHVFNYFDPKAAIWREIGDPDQLTTMERLYFVNVRDGDANRFLANGRNYRTTSVFGPSHPQSITKDRPAELEIMLGEDFSAVRERDHQPQITLHLDVPAVQQVEQLHVRLNGQELTDAKLTDGWVDYAVAPELVKPGANRVEIAADLSAFKGDQWNAVYEGEGKPDRLWKRDPGSSRTHEENVEGSLLIADRGDVSGDYLYYRYPWGADPTGDAVVEARVRVQSGSSFLIVTNGSGGERLALWPDRIELFHHRDLRYQMDTTDDFHLYRMELSGLDLKVYVDGQLRIDAPGALGPRAGYSRNEVAFGAANSGMMGEALWDTIRARAGGLMCQDLVVSIK